MPTSQGAVCGYTWAVTRRQAQLYVTRSRAASPLRGQQTHYLERVLEGAEADEAAQVALAEQLRRCGLDDFDQRPALVAAAGDLGRPAIVAVAS